MEKFSFCFVIIVSLISFCFSENSTSTTEKMETTTMSVNQLIDAILDDNSTENPVTTEEPSASVKPPRTLISNNPNDIGFYLYDDRQDLMSNKKIILNDTASLLASGYNPLRPLIIIIHGFSENYTSEFPQNTKDEYLNANTKSNIIIVDWGKLSTPIGGVFNFMLYPFAANNVIITGKRIVEFLTFLMTSGVLNGPEVVHMVGYDLGAHVAGVAGNRVLQNITNGTNIPASVKPVQRITGLDPSGPQMVAKPENKLDSTDASFVDIIHTNQGGMGYIGSIGHADFYVNGGGPFQPGCNDVMDPKKGFCSHRKAYLYFIRSITDDKEDSMKGCQCLTYIDILCRKICKNSATMGEHCSSNVRGNFYIDLKPDYDSDANRMQTMKAELEMMSMLRKTA